MCRWLSIKKCLKISKRYSEAVNKRVYSPYATENTMNKKKTKVDKIINRKLKIEQHKQPLNRGLAQVLRKG